MFLDGNHISVTECGCGEPVLLLHGYLSCKESFYYQIKFLSEYFKVIAPDMPGFGASSPLTAAYSIDDYCAWLKRFIDYAGIIRPRIIAHSFGARVAVKYLGAAYGGSAKLVITGGAGIVKPRSPQYIRRVKAYRRVKRFFPKFAERHYGSEEYRTLSSLMKESYKKIVNEDLSAYAERISCPALLIYGRGDSVTPAREEGETFNRLIAGSRLEVIDGGHFCFSDNPQIFNNLVLDFLK